MFSHYVPSPHVPSPELTSPRASFYSSQADMHRPTKHQRARILNLWLFDPTLSPLSYLTSRDLRPRAEFIRRPAEFAPLQGLVTAPSTTRRRHSSSFPALHTRLHHCGPIDRLIPTIPPSRADGLQWQAHENTRRSHHLRVPPSRPWQAMMPLLHRGARIPPPPPDVQARDRSC